MQQSPGTFGHVPGPDAASVHVRRAGVNLQVVDDGDDATSAHESHIPMAESATRRQRSSSASTSALELRSPQETPDKARSKVYFQRIRLPIIHEDFPTVSKWDGFWKEISCILCGANASIKRGGTEATFYKGWLGLFNHIRHAHKDRISAPVQDAEKLMRTRPISDQDVKLMNDGHHPHVEIMKNAGFNTTTDSNQTAARSTKDASPSSSRKRPTTQDTFRAIEEASETIETPARKKRLSAMAASKCTTEQYRRPYAYDQDDEEDFPAVRRTL